MDENSKIAGDGGAPKPTTTTTAAVDEGNPISIAEVATSGSEAADCGSEVVRTQSSSARTPFTNLSQVDADLALARTLQEQERAYMMLSMGGGIGYGRWDTGLYVHGGEDGDFDDSHDHGYDDVDDDDDEDDDDEEDEDDGQNYDENDEDAFDVHAHTDSGDDTDRVELDPSAFPDDEAYARALQDAEEREMAARLLAMAGITEREIVDVEEHEEDEGNSQDTWEEVDPDELSYEELIALGEVIGTESRGLSADTIASLPLTNYKAQKTEEAETDSCVICRLDYEDGDGLTTLPCKHAYHSDCINNWLKINKACPVCSTEVSTSGNS